MYGRKESVTSPWRRSGVRKSSTWRNRVCELQDSRTRRRARLKTIANISRWLPKQREHGLLRLYCNSADETAAGRAAENFPDPRSMTLSLRTDNFAYIIQVYIMANTSSHGIINIRGPNKNWVGRKL